LQKDRDLSFDVFRGVAIIAVVALHVVYLGGYWSPRFLFCCQLFNFGVPAFIFISGYWMAKKPIRSLQDYKTYLIKRLSRILIPYFFWSFLLLAYAAISTGDVNMQKIIFKLLTGRASFPYFFIILIAQFYVITPLLQYINRKRYGLMLVLIVNVISLLLRYLSKLHFNYWFPSVSLFYSWIIFYEIGLLVGGFDSKIFAAKKGLLFILPALLGCLLISELEGIIILSKYDNFHFAAHALKYSAFMYSVCVIFGFLSVREYFHHWPKLLVTIGYYSFGIYLIHVPVLTRVVGVLKETKIYPSPVLYQLVVGLITISICLALISTTRMLLPKSFCRKVLGF
jgi:peptidoglycan/LPS O-acetylase OafA/YrhL